jgi:hypothetical protein
MDISMIKIDFEFDSEYGKYRDAIVLEDNHGVSDNQIDAIKQQRFENWKAHIIAASEVTEEETEAAQAEEYAEEQTEEPQE